MTHLEKFVALYKEFGIDCKVNKDDDGIFFIALCNDYFRNNDRKCTISKRFIIYNNCHPEIVFDKDGNFIEHVFWV